MKVYRTGSLFKSARVTGPTQHFLSVEFSQTNDPIEFLIAETLKPVSDQCVVTYLERSINACSDKLPIQSIFNIRRLFVSEKDEPNEEAYTDLLRDIIICAEEELEA